MAYVEHWLIMCSIYIMLASSLDLVVGHRGALSLCHAAFFGLGAYTSALLSTETSVSFLGGVFVGAALASACSLLVSVPALRMTIDYFVIATFVLQVVMSSIITNWVSVTRGPLGIPGIPHPTVSGWEIDTQLEFLLLVGMCTAACLWIVRRLTTGPYGRVLHAIREDEAVASTYGKNCPRFKVSAVAISAALAAIAGSLYAHHITYIDSTMFDVMESILVLSMALVGGAGSFWGPVVGAVFLVSLQELLRFVGLPPVLAANLRQMVYGLLLIAVMMRKPEGLLGRFRFE